MRKEMASVLIAAGSIAGITILACAHDCSADEASSSKTVPSHAVETNRVSSQRLVQEDGQPRASAQPAVNVGNKICPVSGEKIGDAGKSGMQPATYEYQGKIYNFCCPDCIAEFKKDPEKYIKKVQEELNGAGEAR